MGTEINSKGIRPDIIIVNENGRAIIFELKYKKTAEITLKDCTKKNYRDIINEVKGNIKIKEEILIGLNIDEEKNVTFSFNLFTNIKKNK